MNASGRPPGHPDVDLVVLTADEVARRAGDWTPRQAAEVGRAAGYRFAVDSAAFLARRAVLRQLLAQRLGIDAAAVRLVEDPGGKLRLDEAVHPALAFNCSRTDGLVACAFSSRPAVGVDIERLRPVPEAAGITASFLGQEALGALAMPGEPGRRFLLLWTIAEAYVKATGAGLGGLPVDVPYAAVAEALEAGRTWQGTIEGRGWTLQTSWLPDAICTVAVATGDEPGPY